MPYSLFSHTARITSSLQQLRQYAQKWDNMHPNDKLHQLKEESAQFLWAIAFSALPKRILELGCGSGYSTLWLASTLVDQRAILVSLDLNPSKIEIARAHIDRAGLTDKVIFHSSSLSDKILDEHFSQGIDLLFLDCAKPDYYPMFAKTLPYLSEHSIIVADNAISKVQQLSDFIRALEQLELSHIVKFAVIPCSSGLLVARFTQKAVLTDFQNQPDQPETIM